MAEQENKPQEQAAGAQPAAAPQSPQAMQQGQQKPCPKDCMKCSLGHQIYCTAQMTFNSFSVLSHIITQINAQMAQVEAQSLKLDAVTEKIDAQSAKIAELSGRISVIESERAEFASPEPMQGDLFPTEKK